MKADIRMLLECGGIFMLTGWEKSRGARLEYDIAIQTGKTIVYQDALRFQLLCRSQDKTA